MIPMVDLKTQYESLKEDIDASVLDVLANTQFILGPNVQALEAEVAAYLGAPHAVTCASGTDALHLALRAAGIGPGDEVITSAFTFIATAEAIAYVGATPVFVDIDPRSFNLDPDLTEAAITPKTRAIMPVHLFGQPADMPRFSAMCQAHDLLLIEDCAQSFGARIGEQQTGSIGDMGCFSFFPSKNLGCYGDGGLVTARDEAQAALLKNLRNHGSDVRYHHDRIGYNSRLDEMQAAILRVKLRHIDAFNAGRRRAAGDYRQALKDVPDLHIPHEDGIGEHVYHQYTLLSPRRDDIMKALQAAQIACAIYYPIPLHQQKAFTDWAEPVTLPHTEAVAAQCLSLPMYPELPEEAIAQIADVIRTSLR
ncbi:dTDP-4-amino-4,6-dideoxygalactose transaminase [Ectothiorhodosinus mongolicus]|uniref:dTDP-4-amino-4,6-dideoxygalactose transaminase n=1 Tax=Ectothiorhodosinus mongolicus TaxID=233100 RepID=A0A1R3VMU7_9GAMM|nr:DegT/DnrJ/EryC1/StrS family aminotransferase [Ectothiorhodosinus mongolicus]ULX56352.1 DegT/DnrJ/EryC1/StrS family aminotransferase [Ectothiorhodosinus mongolicus]SIT65866.1 dTDP-4-amino-4,6-dideoxygalactose transaminase [Ectothiorhodosinus mongolicus]